MLDDQSLNKLLHKKELKKKVIFDILCHGLGASLVLLSVVQYSIGGYIEVDNTLGCRHQIFTIDCSYVMQA